jgi:hypothetical protein
LWPTAKDHLEKLGIPLGATFHPFAHPFEQEGVIMKKKTHQNKFSCANLMIISAD